MQTHRKEKPTDSLDWSRKFDILSISRLSLTSSGIPTQLVASLTDEDMEQIAERIAGYVLIEPIEQIAEFVARLSIAEKGVQSVSEEPMRETGNT